jgi:hypothetical protein
MAFRLSTTVLLAVVALFGAGLAGTRLDAALTPTPGPTAVPTPMLWTDQNLDPAVMAELEAAQDLALSLRYDEAEARIRAATLKAPEHPLCGVFLIGVLLARIQENFKVGVKVVPPAFFEEADRVVAQAQAEQAAYPRSPYPLLYEGAAYGIRGLAKLYAGSYVSSYWDGKKGSGYLREAVAIDPALYNAYMGLGQFEYYCGTLGGVLQFLLALPGDPEKGLAMLKTCEDKGTYAAWPCKAYRIRLMTGERKQFAAAAPELTALVDHYPGNLDFAEAVFKTLDAGIDTPELRSAAEGVLKRLDAGWKTPAYAHLDPPALRWTLAEAYLKAGETESARTLLERLEAAPEPWHARAVDRLRSIR